MNILLPDEKYLHVLLDHCFGWDIVFSMLQKIKLIFLMWVCLLTASWQLEAGAQETISTIDILSTSAASPWVENEYIKSRIVSSHSGVAQDPSVLHYLGWEIILKKNGWKTYWRSPGDAGNPPRFTWDGSVNLAKADVYFPRPERFQIFGIQTFGYGNRVILPIRIAPQIGGSAMKVRVQAEFMACKEICIPFNAEYSLDLPASVGKIGMEHQQSVYADDIRSFVLEVPQAGADKNDRLEVAEVSLAGVAGQQSLSILLLGENHLAGADAFIEAPKHFKFGAPQKQLLGTGNELRMVFPVHSTLAGAVLNGEELLVTIHDGWGYAREQHVTLP